MEEILDDWESFAQTLLPAGKTLNQAALRDDAENLLRAIALDMETAQSPAQQALKSKGGRRSLEAQNSHRHGVVCMCVDWRSFLCLLVRRDSRSCNYLILCGSIRDRL